MFFKNWRVAQVKNTRSVQAHCDNCSNDSEQIICTEHVVGVGIIFFKEPLLSIKKYWLVCPVCGNGTKRLSKEQVDAYKIS